MSCVHPSVHSFMSYFECPVGTKHHSKNADRTQQARFGSHGAGTCLILRQVVLESLPWRLQIEGAPPPRVLGRPVQPCWLRTLPNGMR
jgi:hypothetical protein